jgi:hypothetical protein
MERNIMVTAEQVQAGISQAKAEATKFFYERLGGVDQFACGFGWVEVYVDRTNSKQAQELIKAGFRKDYKPKCLTLWDPAGLPVQNVDVKEVGADALAKYLTALGLTAYGCSRLD